MFASHEKNVGKKIFQKPNILRKKTKVSVQNPNTSNTNESPETRSLVTTHVDTRNLTEDLDKIILEGSTPMNVVNSGWKLSLGNSFDENNIQISQEADCSKIANNTSIHKSFDQNTLNIESFLNVGVTKEDTILSYTTAASTENKTPQAKNKWGHDITNNFADILVSSYRHQELGDLKGDKDSVIVIHPAPISDEPPKQEHDQTSCKRTPAKTIPVECFSSRPVKLKCDYPNCNKGFWTEEKLNKHKNSHNKPVIRTPSQNPIACPVKKVINDGTEEKCPRTFEVRGELIKHLNDDHTLDDAQHRCAVCGRRFFWASGLRAHGASACARGGLACAWPGCGRVFRLPCRLREHARAHTGDRPYLCRYPDCGWAFRSASKLLRHARRHTDDRKHACATCGRAFMRREHLRDHCVRHHHPTARATHLCTHPGCEQTFTNMSTLYLHMKKVHRNVEKTSAANNVADQSTNVKEDGDNIYLVNMVPQDINGEDASVREESPVSVEAEGERAWRAARTHLTWPLARPAHVERTEGSSTDVYTVRSDLFLHGNVPIDEDSQNMVGEAAGAALDSDLCLDAHPTIDLMQEELMYEDAAVDETSFRVFLLNGEELT